METRSIIRSVRNLLWVQSMSQVNAHLKEKRFTEDTKPFTEGKMHMRLICYLNSPTSESVYRVKHFGVECNNLFSHIISALKKDCILVC